MTTAQLIEHDSRFGPFRALTVDDVVIAASWNETVEDLVRRTHPSRRPGTIRESAGPNAVREALREYDAGDCSAIDRIRVAQHSGPFHARVRDALRSIPSGTTLTYADLAAIAGTPGAARAAGAACARNAIALFVPCHRAVGSDGTLRGFAYGLSHKAALLDHERGCGPQGSAQMPAIVGS